MHYAVLRLLNSYDNEKWHILHSSKQTETHVFDERYYIDIDASLCRLPLGKKRGTLRDAGHDKVKIHRWRGPTTVTSIEKDEDGRPLVHWLVHISSLGHCTPEHVRPISEEESRDNRDDIEQARLAMNHVINRS